MKTYKLKNVAIILGIAWSSVSFAQGTQTGGGRGIVCFTTKNIASRILDWKNPRRGIVTESDIPHVTDVETLDYYWAKQANVNVGLISYPASSDDYALVDAVRNRVSDGLPEVAHNLAVFSANHSDRDQIVKLTNGLQQLDDAAEAFVPDERCIITTIARQSNQGNGIVLEIDNRLLSRMKNDYSKKSLFLHETIYSWARSRGANTSDGVRTILARLISKQPITEQFLALLKSNNMQVTEGLFESTYDSIYEKIWKEIDQNIVKKGIETAAHKMLSTVGFSQDAINKIAPALIADSYQIIKSKNYLHDDQFDFSNLGSTSTKSATRQFLGELASSGPLDELFKRLQNANSAHETLSKEYDACNKRSCRKALVEKLSEAIKIQSLTNTQWQEVEDFMYHASFRKTWVIDGYQERGMTIVFTCGATAKKPEALIQVCQKYAADMNAAYLLELPEGNKSFETKLAKEIYNEIEKLRSASYRSGNLALLLKDETLNKVPHNRSEVQIVLRATYPALQFTYERNYWSLSDFKIP